MCSARLFRLLTNSDITENIREHIETARVCWAWVANLILLHYFRVPLKIRRGTKARVSPASLTIFEDWEPLRGDGVRA